MSAGKRIKNLRTGLHLSQDYIANQLGIDRKDYARIESGRRELKTDELLKLSQLFGVSENQIYAMAHTTRKITPNKSLCFSILTFLVS